MWSLSRSMQNLLANHVGCTSCNSLKFKKKDLQVDICCADYYSLKKKKYNSLKCRQVALWEGITLNN